MSSRRGDPTRLQVQVSARSGAEFAPFLKRHVALAYTLALTQRRASLRDLSLALVGDTSMSRLHRQFMDIDGPTDVLTFELDHDSRGVVTVGEVVVCVPQARRQARIHGTDLKNELLLYAVHGMLHLIGYDDLTDAGYRAMHREEDRILMALKVGPVFDPARGKPADRATRARRKKDGRTR